jgi:lipoprotein signal peptidase
MPLRPDAVPRIDPPSAGWTWSRGESPRVGFVLCAVAVAAADLVSKRLAGTLLGSRGEMPLRLFGGGVRLAVVLNNQSAFGVSLGRYTWHINFALTVLALVLAAALCRALAVLDAWAPVMLGLIAGAATGNLVSLVSSPRGVLDFIAVDQGGGRELVFNLADVAAILGVLLLIRTAWTVGREIMRSRE